MKVIVSRSGGIAGLTHTWSVLVEQQPDEQSWRGIIDALPWDNTPAPSHGADRFLYEIRINTRRVVISETQLSGPWRTLVEKVRSVSDPMRPNGARPR